MIGRQACPGVALLALALALAAAGASQLPLRLVDTRGSQQPSGEEPWILAQGRRLAEENPSDSAEEVEVKQCPHGYLERQVPICLALSSMPVTSSEASSSRRRLLQGGGGGGGGGSGGSSPASTPAATTAAPSSGGGGGASSSTPVATTAAPSAGGGGGGGGGSASTPAATTAAPSSGSGGGGGGGSSSTPVATTAAPSGGQGGGSTPSTSAPTPAPTPVPTMSLPICIDRDRYVYHVCLGYEQYCTEYAPTCKTYANVGGTCRYFMDGPDGKDYPIGPVVGDDDDISGIGTAFICSSSSLKCINEDLSCEGTEDVCTKYTIEDGDVNIDPPACSSSACLECTTECVEFEASCVEEASVCSSYSFLCQDQNLCVGWSDICQRYEEVCATTALACDEIQVVDGFCATTTLERVCVKDTSDNRDALENAFGNQATRFFEGSEDDDEDDDSSSDK